MLLNVAGVSLLMELSPGFQGGGINPNGLNEVRRTSEARAWMCEAQCQKS